MSNTLSDKIGDTGHAIAEATRNVCRKIVDGIEYVKEQIEPAHGENVRTAAITEHMDVIASCGKKVGVVDRIEGAAIKLTRKDNRTAGIISFRQTGSNASTTRFT